MAWREALSSTNAMLLKTQDQGQDASVEALGSAAIPAIVADTLAIGDQQISLENRHPAEVTTNPLQLDVVAQEDKNEHLKEGEWRNARQGHGTSKENEKMWIDFELTVLKHQHEENEKRRQHEEKMEQMRQQTPSRTTARGEEEPLGGRLDPITEIELEKMRMEFELAKLKHISEENERQRQHEQKMFEDKEKQRQHEEKMEQARQRQGPLCVGGQKASGNKADATAETSSVAFAEGGKVRIELQLAMQVYLPEMSEKKPPCDLSGQQESPMLEEKVENKPEAENLPVVPAPQENDRVTEHLGLQVPRIVVNGPQAEWSSSRLDLAIETELEKRRMEFELTRMRYEHEENERQRQHEEKMEQLRQQAPSKESE